MRAVRPVKRTRRMLTAPCPDPSAEVSPTQVPKREHRCLQARQPTKYELKATTVLALPLEEVSAKVRTLRYRTLCRLTMPC